MDKDLASLAAAYNKTMRQYEARFRALEMVVANNIAAQYHLLDFTLEDVKHNHENAREQMSRLTFPRLDPAASDDWAAEQQTAVAELLKKIEAMFQDKIGI